MLPENHADEPLPWKLIVAKSVHDMRTPLSCMRTTLEILRMTSGDDEQQMKMISILDCQLNELACHLDQLVRNPEQIVRISPPPSIEDPS